MAKRASVWLHVILAVLAIAVAFPVSAQQNYPNRPVRLVSGYAAGGTTSLIGRLIGQKLSETWGQQFVLDNRPGGGTLIAGEIVAKSVPDGHTLMLVDSAHVIAPLLLKAPFDPIKDFSVVALLANTEWLLLVHPSLPPNNVLDFLSYVKARRGKLNYASPAIGGSQHLGTEMFNSVTGIEVHHIPYKSAGPALVALVAGEVEMYFATTATGAPHVKANRAKALAYTGTRRSPLLPDLPTLEEAGVSNYNYPRIGYGIIGPAGMPKHIVDKLAIEINRQVAQPEFRNTLINVGLEPTPKMSQEYLEALKAGSTSYGGIINQLKKKGVKFD
jgi:tripartite-type tricarboxylate transporter receptor subunit TctC